MFWPWWLGAMALTGIAVGFWWLVRRPFAVSGSMTRVVEWREERALAEAERGMGDPAALARALAQATEEEFGSAAASGDPAGQPAPIELPAPRPRWSAHLTFLAMIAVGALIAALTHGGVALHTDMGDEFQRLFGGGWRMGLTLLGGGILVGAGTRMAGGCTSGHGLSGCARLQPGSLITTASFFGTAIGVSLLLERLL